jgi:hypothetical protein
MAASWQDMFVFGQIIIFLARRPTNRNVSLGPLTQNITIAARRFPAAASSGLRALVIRRLPYP